MNLSFVLNEEDDILNTIIRDSDTGLVVYTIETLKCAGGALTTTVMGQNQIVGWTRLAFRILWKGGKESLGDAMIVLGDRISQIPVGELLESTPGSNT